MPQLISVGEYTCRKNDAPHLHVASANKGYRCPERSGGPAER
jgi:hypothetical protein